MRVDLPLLCCIFCILLTLQESQAKRKRKNGRKQIIFKEEPVVPCGGRNSRQVDVRGSRAQRRTAEVIIAAFKRNLIGCDEEGPRTLLKHKEFRIDLQDSRWFEKDGKHWRNLQLQQNIPRKPGFPTSVTTVLIQCDKTFPIRYVRNAFVKSMKQCAKVWLYHQ